MKKKPLTKQRQAQLERVIKRIRLEDAVVKAAINWYTAAPTEPCEYGKKCKKHAKVCQLEFAVRELLKEKK